MLKVALILLFRAATDFSEKHFHNNFTKIHEPVEIKVQNK